jgi:DMSO/TMAO reductase YedYZ molybdopterin-dependent catalytic subunit
MKLPRGLPAEPPPGPARPDFWKSPVRGAWLTTIIGSTLLVAITIVAVTGFMSHAAYQPNLGTNALVPKNKDLGLFVLPWPTWPTYLFAISQGAHVTFGLMIVPLLLAKLWSVIPKLFAWPPPTKPAEGLERLSIGILVAAAFFQLATGLTNAQLYYPWHFNFVVEHYYGAIVFISALVFHIVVKFPTMRHARAHRHDTLDELDDLRAPSPEPESISRRGVLAMVGGASGLIFVTVSGQSIGGPFRRFALFGARGTGEHFPVNKGAKIARITPELVDNWMLKLVAGDRTMEFSRADLEAMVQHHYTLPIACVEGWSTTQHWSGVRLRDLAAHVGVSNAATMHVVSLQPAGAFKQTTLGRSQVNSEKSLLALQVNGKDLSMDHGYPARIIVPALPGVHCTKWVSSLEFYT